VSCSLSFDANLTKSGTYRLLISEIGNDEAGGYTVSLQCLMGECPEGADDIVAIIEEPSCQGAAVLAAVRDRNALVGTLRGRKRSANRVPDGGGMIA
jgi:hypothetical protein